MSLNLQPITFAEAKGFIAEKHRHHIPSVGWKFGIAVNDGDKVVGVITVGRPVSRMFDDGFTLEVNRCCTDGTRNACSILYGAAWRAAKALGYKRIVTYTLPSESGSSLRGAGYKILHQTKGGSWNCAARPRIDKFPTQEKLCWGRI